MERDKGRVRPNYLLKGGSWPSIVTVLYIYYIHFPVTLDTDWNPNRRPVQTTQGTSHNWNMFAYSFNLFSFATLAARGREGKSTAVRSFYADIVCRGCHPTKIGDPLTSRATGRQQVGEEGGPSLVCGLPFEALPSQSWFLQPEVTQ